MLQQLSGVFSTRATSLGTSFRISWRSDLDACTTLLAPWQFRGQSRPKSKFQRSRFGRLEDPMAHAEKKQLRTVWTWKKWCKYSQRPQILRLRKPDFFFRMYKEVSTSLQSSCLLRILKSANSREVLYPGNPGRLGLENEKSTELLSVRQCCHVLPL